MTTLTLPTAQPHLATGIRSDLIRVALIAMIFLNLGLGTMLAARDAEPIPPQPVEWFGNVAVHTR